MAKFFIEFWNKQLGCIADQVEFVAPSAEALGHLLGLDGIDDFCSYELDVNDLRLLESVADRPLPGSDWKSVLRAHHWLDDLSYPTHTNRELCMMLEGLKPLAVFASAHPAMEPSDEIPEKYFEPYVNAGRFIFREFIEPSKDAKFPGIRNVLFSLPDHQWRIEAYVLMLHTAAIEGWNNAFERMQGSLLGYEDWQNDEFLALRETHLRSTTLK